MGYACAGMQYLARCHCGQITAHYHTNRPPSAWELRACQCSFCRAHGALSASDPQGLLVFCAAAPALLQRYRFAARSAEFLICRECGLYVGAQLSAASERRGILNVRALSVALSALPRPQAVDYASESSTARESRRLARWTPLAPESL